ncbi:sensor histidine kinase [Pyxidicoccus trucidator]|uniref:sensor histidine kinase n=1 Tax=Pyxidicoccus trucidator TaxID=2709662 RepID=UPI0013DBF81F|nr:ATP-binding protein [Pyxidicoccus trucidator]
MKGEASGGREGPAWQSVAPASSAVERLLQVGASLHATLVVDSHARIVWIDALLALAAGWQDSAPIGHRVGEALGSLPWLTRALDAALTGREGLCEGSGQGQRLSAVVVPVFGEAGVQLGACACLRVAEPARPPSGQAPQDVLADAAEERQAREHLEEKSSLLRATFDSIADGVVVVDLARRITAFNKRFQEIWGLTDAMLEERDAEKAVVRAAPLVKDPERFVTLILRRFQPSPEEDVDTVELKDGRTLERKSLPMRSGDSVIGRVWSYRDVTMAVRAQAERERLLREAQEAIRVREDFLSIAAHELKTPLTPLKLHLQMMEGQARSGRPVAPRHVHKALSQVSRLAVLVNDLLDASRIQAGRLELARERISLGSFLHEAVSDFRSLSALHALEYEEPGEPLVILGDRSRLSQVLMNLVENAFKYSPGGGTVRVTARREGARAVVSVKDSGIGIPADQTAHLFERFFRARNAPISGFGGLGLGLYICHDIIERHGGSIWVDSEQGNGSTFHFSLPLLADGGLRV